MISVILIEDHDGLREDTVLGLNAEGLQAQGVADSASFYRLYQLGTPDVVVIDRMLVGEDGMAIARRLRESGAAKRTGIVILSSLGSLDERIEGLGLADGYLVKPADLRELAALITSVYRRINFVSDDEGIGEWRLLRRRLELISPQGQRVELSFKEFQVLSLLATANGTPVTARKLVESMDENWLQYEKNRLELMLSRLRQKIRLTNGESLNPIKSIRNEGYLLTLSMAAIN